MAYRCEPDGEDAHIRTRGDVLTYGDDKNTHRDR